jgi:hypothetical protein
MKRKAPDEQAAPGMRTILSVSLMISLGTQTANTVLAGPTAAGPSAPTFRALACGRRDGWGHEDLAPCGALTPQRGWSRTDSVR